MRRREFIRSIGSAVIGWPLTARAQQPELVRRIGVLQPHPDDDAEVRREMAAFEQELQSLGWINGGNLRIEYRWAGEDPKRIRSYAAELVALKPDVIFTNTSLALLPLKQQTVTIPLVFTFIYDPVGSGFVESLARPGGNITGFTIGEFTLGSKMLELLKEVVPNLRRVGILLNPDQSPHLAMRRAIDEAAPALNLEAIPIDVRDAAEIERGIESLAGKSDRGLVVLPSPITAVNRRLVIVLAARHGLPAVYGFRFFVKDGGLLSYGVEPLDLFRRAASYVDRILKGAKPADLPVENPTRFELAINLNAAKALGLQIPEAFLVRADEVIE
jgi:putative ABC transport system substrate-binding protein